MDTNKTKVPGVTLGADINGTGLQGYLVASYADLVRLLGEPNGYGDEYKVSSEWELTFEGQPFTIYDYKDTSLYDKDNPSVQAFRSQPSYEWHIGGKVSCERFVEAMKKALGELKHYERWGGDGEDTD